MKAVLILDVINKDNAIFDTIEYAGIKYKIQEQMKIPISFSEIESEIGSKIVELKIIEKKGEQSHCFEVVEGDNYGILFTSHGKTRDLIFKENEKINFKVELEKPFEKNIISCNGINRLLLINLSNIDDIYINGKYLTYKLTDLSIENSIQISVVDLEKGIFPYKNIIKRNENLFFNLYQENYKKLDIFYELLKDYFDSNKISDKEMLKKLEDLEKLEEIILTKFNIPKRILKEKYNDSKYFEFVSGCTLLYLIHEFLKSEKEFIQIKKNYELFIKYKNQIQEDSDLDNYLKCTIILELGIFMEQIGDFQVFEQMNFKYYLRKKFEPDSIGYSSLQFLEKFINNLSEDSPFFFPLTLIDSGAYIYNGNSVYGRGVINKKLLINHLKDILPDVLFTYYDNKTNQINNQAITNKASGCITINLHSLFSTGEKMNIVEPIKEKIILENYSLKMLTILFHEVFGHKKTGYISNTSSPSRFFNQKDGSLMELRHRNSCEKGKNIIKILRQENLDYDSGHFLEYFFGECEYGYIFELFENMILNNVDLNHLFNIEYFHQKIDTLRKYIRLKYIVYIQNKELAEKLKDETIEKEIKNIENYIEKNKISFKKEETSNYNSQKKSPQAYKKMIIFSKENNLKFDYYYYINQSSEDIRNKMEDKNTPPELRGMLRKILLNRIRKK